LALAFGANGSVYAGGRFDSVGCFDDGGYIKRYTRVGLAAFPGDIIFAGDFEPLYFC
jgi:hypothetical protein